MVLKKHTLLKCIQHCVQIVRILTQKQLYPKTYNTEKSLFFIDF